MPRIKNFALPAPLTEALVAELQNMPESLLLEWARECLPGGFTRADLIRSRLGAQIRSEAPLDPRLQALLTDTFPFRSTVQALSLFALQEIHGPLETVVGRETLLIALLLDPREEVHRWGVEQSGKPALETNDQNREFAEDDLYFFFSERIMDPIGIALPEPVPSEPPPGEFVDFLANSTIKELGEKVESQKKSIERLNNELHQQKLRHTAKLKEQSDALERERKAVRSELSTAQAAVARMQKEKHALETQLSALSSQLDTRVAARVEEQTSALVRKWLSVPLSTEAAAKTFEPGTAELLARVEHALAAQARQDRHSGNRLELRARLDSLDRARAQVLEALQNAIHPISELKNLEANLATEIGRLSQLLGNGPAHSELLTHMLAEVNTAGTWEDARRASALADQLAEHKLLGHEERRQLYHAVQRKFSLLQETQPPTTPDGDNGWSLRDTIFRNKSALLVLDGHNVLYSLTDIFGADYENGHPGQKARQHLADLVEKLLRDRSNLQGKLCFDGPDARSIRISPNVTLEYSGGTGPNRADELILSKLLFKDLKSLDQRVFVVTDDRQVRHGALQTGAKFVRTDLFAVLLADFKCL